MSYWSYVPKVVMLVWFCKLYRLEEVRWWVEMIVVGFIWFL